MVDKYVHLKMNAGTKMFLAMIFFFSFCSACQSATPPIENVPVATSLPTAIPLPTSTFAVDKQDTTSETMVTHMPVTQLDTLHILKGNAGHIVAIDFSPDDLQLISLGGDFTLKQWEVDSGEELSSL